MNANEMSDDQLNRAIAAACGITPFAKHDWCDKDERRYFECSRCGEYIGYKDYCAEKKPFHDSCRGNDLNYAESLDAMAQAEPSLSESERLNYAEYLTGNLTEEFRDLAGTLEHIYACATFTARQKAEAFVLAKED